MEAHGRYLLPKIENSSDLDHYFWGGAQNTNKKINKYQTWEPILDLRGPKSFFRTHKSMKENIPELYGSLKGRKSVLKF